MKIPTYKSQVKMTDRVAAQRMNVQANSAAFEGPGQAVAALGKQIAAQSSWMEQEQKLVNASEVSNAKRLYATDLIQLENDISIDPKYNSNPIEARKQFETKSRSLFKTRSLNVKGNLAKTTFSTEAENLKAPSRLRTTKLARTRLVSENIVEKLSTASEAEKKLAELDPTSKDYKDLLETIIGVKDIHGNIIKPGVFGELALNGSIKAQDQLKYERKFLSGVSRNTVNKLLLGASTVSGSKDDLANGTAGKQAMLVYNQLQNPNQHPNLTATDRTKLSEEALRLATQLDNRRISLFNQQESREKKKRTEKQKTNFNALISRIQKFRQDPRNLKKGEIKVAPIEANQLLENGDISVSQHNAVIKALNDQGAVVSDKDYIASLIRKISEAPDKFVIAKVVNEAYKNVNTRLNYADLTMVRQAGEQYTSKTPRAKLATKLGSLLKTLTATSGVMDRIMPGSGKRGESVYDGYLLQVADGDSPLEAFQEAFESYNTTERIILKEIPLPRFRPNVAQSMEVSSMVDDFNQSSPEKRDLSKWTLRDIAWSRNKAQTEWKGKVGSLARQEVYLDMLERYVEQRESAKAAINAGELEDAK